MNRLDRLVERMKGIPTLPDVALHAIDLLQDADYDVSAVAGTIARDPVLASRVVGVANSPFFALGVPTSCVKTSILRLGARETRTLVLSVAITRVVPALPAPLDVRRFWGFGLASALCAREVAADLDYADRDAAHLGALVHRLGEAFLAIAFPERFHGAWQRARHQALDLTDTLQKEFGVYPSDLCARALAEWGLPTAVVDAVREAREPENAEKQPILSLVIWTAGWVTTELGLGLEPPRDEANRWCDQLSEGMHRELYELGYGRTIDYLSGRPEFAEQVQSLSRLVAGSRRAREWAGQLRRAIAG